MPSVVAADPETAAALHGRFGLPPTAALFKVGRGEARSQEGVKQPLDIFSYLGNDTLLTSPGDFEITGAAQIRLLAGMRRK
jgi:hypothetical protein